MQRINTRYAAWFTAIALALVTSLAARPAAVEASGATIPPGGDTYGQSYGEWGDDWWNWAIKAPLESSPLADETGQFGHQGQGGPVFYLAGTSGGSAERWLKIPHNRAVFFPLVNSVWWTPDDGPTEASVRALANEVADGATGLYCTLDGQPCTDDDLADYRAASPAGGFNLRILPNSLFTDFGIPAGDRDPSVSDGYWVMLAPLSTGDHTLEFGGAFDSGPFAGFSVDVVYHLDILGPVD